VLALGGGGARGLAHVGVLDVLLEAGITVHAVAGTSMGAIVGGVFAAAGAAPESPRQLASLLAVAPHSPLPVARRRRQFRDWFDTAAYPRDDVFGLGRDDGEALEAGIEAWVGKRRIEELPIPFVAVATDVRTGDVVAIDHGPLAPAVHVSAALPGVYRPVCIDGRLLIDGGEDGQRRRWTA
jgi:NTE family protein